MVKLVSTPADVQVVTTRPKPQRVLRFQRLLGFFLCCFVVVQSLRLLTFYRDDASGLQPAQVSSSQCHRGNCGCGCDCDCHPPPHPPHRRDELRAICKSIHRPAGPPQSTCPCGRTENDRFVPGTPSVLLRNASIWTGARNGTEIVYGDVLLNRGIVAAVGYIPPSLLESIAQVQGSEMIVQDVGGAWITPGLVDLHSHLGVYSAPALSGKCKSFHPRWNDEDGYFPRIERRKFSPGTYTPLASKHRWFKHS